MANLQRQIETLPEFGGRTKGVYLPNKVIKNVLEDMQTRESSGEESVSFASVVKEILSDYYSFQNPSNRAV
jgi:hypothetical protein